MKKLLFIIAMMLPMFVFIECTGKKNVNAIKTKKPTEQLTIFLNQCLLEHPNALNNEVTRTILADTIRERLLKFQNDTLPILSNLPMRYKGCMECHIEGDFLLIWIDGDIINVLRIGSHSELFGKKK